MWAKFTGAINIFKRVPTTVGQIGQRTISTGATFAKNTSDRLGSILKKHPSSTTDTTNQNEPLRRLHSRLSPRAKRYVHLFIIIAALTTIGMAAVVIKWAYEQVVHYQIVGVLFVPVVIFGFWFIARFLWLEIASWRRLIVVEDIQTALSPNVDTQTDRGQFTIALKKLKKTIQKSHRPAVLEIIKNAKDETRSLDDLQNELGKVFHNMDREAVNHISRAVHQLFFFSAVSPTRSIDGAAFIVRAVGLIHEVALTYGYRPGKTGVIHLCRRVLVNAAVLPTAITITEKITNQVSPIIARYVKTALGKGVNVGTVSLVYVAAVYLNIKPQHVRHVAEGLGKAAEAGITKEGASPPSKAELISEHAVGSITAAAQIAHLGLAAMHAVRPIGLTNSQHKDLWGDLLRQIFSLHEKAVPEGSEEILQDQKV